VVTPELVVVRHGRTAWNRQGRFQGHGDPGLDALGRRQAAAVAEALARYGPLAVVSSDLRRARQTAAVIGRAAGVPVATDRRLREVALGCLEGLDRAEAARRCPRQLGRWLEAADARPAGGETVAEAGRRAARAIGDHLARGAADETLVVVGHGLALQAALYCLAGAGVVGIVTDSPHLPNGGWLALRADHGAGVTSRIGAPSRQARMSSTMSG
jgi:broad specificity phosphatase PhoE